MFDIFSLPEDRRQEFIERDKALVDKYLQEKEEFNLSLNSINVYSGAKDYILGLIDADEHPLYIKSVVYPVSTDQRSFYIVREEAKRFKLKLEDIYKLNSKGYRSDEFSKDHNGLHVLFAGCSVTFGHGLLLEHTWPKMVYDILSSRIGMSGFYNVSKLGASRIDIMLTIQAYVKVYGMPDLILINFPDSARDRVAGEDETTPDSVKADFVVEALYENMLERISRNGGSMYSTSWSAEDLKESKRKSILWKQDTFLGFEVDELNEYIYTFLRSNSDNEYLSRYAMKSMDLAHPGIAEQAFYADLFKQQLIDVV